MIPPSGVVTLSSDFGLQDSYVGTMKGVILRLCPDARLVDLTHQISPQDVLEASLVIENAYPFFPRGTVHLAVVDPGVGTQRRPIVIVGETGYFVGPDNGTFSRILLLEEEWRAFEIVNPAYLLPHISDTFHGRDIFAPVAGYLCRGVAPEEFGPEIDDLVRLDLPEPEIRGARILGSVIHIDSFGNILTNVSRELWSLRVGERNFRIAINGRTIDRLQRSYQGADLGRTLAIFGSSNLLEIAVAGGRADRRIGAGKGDAVEIDILPS